MPPPSPSLFFWSALLAAFLAASAMADERIGAVVQRHFNGAQGLLPTAGSHDLLFNYDVFSGETVNTPPNGSTVIRFQDKTQIQVGGNSSLVIDRYVYDPASGAADMAVRFSTGLFRFISGDLKNKEDAKLSTPTASLTIRGTKFILAVASDGTTSLGVIKGAVDAAPCGRGRVSQDAGQAVRIAPTCEASQIALDSVPTDPVTSTDYAVTEDAPAPPGGIDNDKALHDFANAGEAPASEPGPAASPGPAPGPTGGASSPPESPSPPAEGPPSSPPESPGPPAKGPPSSPPESPSPPPKESPSPSLGTRPGNGFGDVNHIHTGPPGLNGASNGKANGKGNAGGNGNSNGNGNAGGNGNSGGNGNGGGNGNAGGNGGSQGHGNGHGS